MKRKETSAMLHNAETLSIARLHGKHQLSEMCSVQCQVERMRQKPTAQGLHRACRWCHCQTVDNVHM
jgi:hypothetical protein